jgi:hypothetical protein
MTAAQPALRTRGIRARDAVRHASRLQQPRACSVVAFPYPASGDPNIIGEHEVPPVRCQCCNAPIAWSIIKGWAS